MIQNLMTGGASVEDMLPLWAASLREAKQRIRPLFGQDRVATSAGQFLDALLGNEPRKTGWMRAEAAGDSGRGDSRPCWVVDIGMPTPCVTSSVTMSSSISAMTPRFW